MQQRCFRAYGAQRAPCIAKAVSPLTRAPRRLAVHSQAGRRAPEQVQQLEQQEAAPLTQQQPEQPKAVALQPPSSRTRAVIAALPEPVQRGLGWVAGALAPLRQAVDKFDPRVRGLILLNAMTLLMGSNWVVVKDSNDAFDPVSNGWQGKAGCPAVEVDVVGGVLSVWGLLNVLVDGIFQKPASLSVQSIIA